jgi:hypothetical protein
MTASLSTSFNAVSCVCTSAEEAWTLIVPSVACVAIRAPMEMSQSVSAVVRVDVE